jgi:hypothetical protein
MYLDKKNYQSFKFLVLTPKLLLTFLDKVSQILVLYNLGKNICFLRKIFGNKMFLAWSEQLENEGMGSRIGVSSFFIG